MWRLIIHDWSKFLPAESRAYTKRFFQGGCPEGEWKVAWRHHVQHNPHHWEHWSQNGELLPMPEVFVREMVADWMAAGKAYAGASNVQDWLNKAAPKMKLHPGTIEILCRVLKQHNTTWPLLGN